MAMSRPSANAFRNSTCKRRSCYLGAMTRESISKTTWRVLGEAAEPVTVPLARLRQTVRDYSWHTFRGDVVAGLTVAVIAVPQSMAYAIIAGVSPVYGIYTVIFQCLIGSVFNSQPLLSVGPINTQSLLVASTVTRLIDPSNEAMYLQLVIALTFVKGLIQIGLASARLGNLVQYVSQSVIVGFTAGAGVLIAAGQIKGFIGVETARQAGHWPGLIGTIQRLWPQLDDASLLTVGIGTLALAIVLVCRSISRFVPGPLIAVCVTGAIVYFLGWAETDPRLVGPIPRALPAPAWPAIDSLTQLESLLAGALALSLLGLMEAFSIGKSIAMKTGTRISANHELFSQGLANLGSSFFSCIPGSGSFSRSALNHFAGGKTVFSGIFNALFVLAIFMVGAPAAKFIPMTAIAAILFVIAFGLIDWRYFRRAIRSDRADAAVCGVTFASTLFLPLAYAVFVGVALNLALYLRRASQLHMSEMVRSTAGPYMERPIMTKQGDQAVRFLQIEGDLFFAMADELQDKLSSIAQSGVRVVVIRLKRTHSLDNTVLGVMEQFVEQMQARGGHVVLCGLRDDIYQRIDEFGLVATIGPDNVFETQFGVFTSAKQALQRARQLVGSSIDTDGVEDDEPNRHWSYSI